MEVIIRNSFEPSDKVSELAVFIDVFRGSTSIIYLLSGGAGEVLGIKDEKELKSALAAGYRLVSEVVKTGMDNSPGKILAAGPRGGKFVHKSGNLTEAVFANPGWERAMICGFVNLDAVAARIRADGVSSVTIIPAHHFAEKMKAVEDESCAVMLKELLSGAEVEEYPYYPEIEAKIRRRKSSGYPFPAHYWEDLRLALRRNTVPVVPEIFKADGKVLFGLKGAGS